MTADPLKHYQAIDTILNSLDALVYVADMQTHELLYLNDYGKAVWGAAGGKCYELLQKDQNSPCAFCTNNKLLDAEGKPKGVYVWEFQNTQNQRWYQCRDQAITWIDGRLVRIEIATDITERKLTEQALAEAKALAEQLADTDELTQINNRRAFFNFGKQLLQQQYRSQQPLGLVMFDLDNFKLVNDKLGHAAGDTVLVAMANIARNQIRAGDILARIGGEEFAILLPDASIAQALQLAERIRQQFEMQNVCNSNTELKCTASFGVADLQLDDKIAVNDAQSVLEALLNKADQALMYAKQHGRNRVIPAA